MKLVELDETNTVQLGGKLYYREAESTPVKKKKKTTPKKNTSKPGKKGIDIRSVTAIILIAVFSFLLFYASP